LTQPAAQILPNAGLVASSADTAWMDLDPQGAMCLRAMIGFTAKRPLHDSVEGTDMRIIVGRCVKQVPRRPG
jgi:hypothetical protein